MVNQFLIFISITGFTFFIHVSGLAQKYNYTPPENLPDGWETGTLIEKEVDTALFYKFFGQLQQGEHQIHSLLVVNDDKLILEEYFGEQGINSTHDLRSATKSILSLLMGIAIDKGIIHDVNDPVTKYIKHPVPEKNIDKRKSEITIRHLLTMSTGLDCNDWDRKSRGQEDKVYKKKDWLQYTLNLPVINNPGDTSLYCSMAAVLMAEVISRAAGMPIDKFADMYLFSPLGITNVQWGHTSSKEVIASAKRLYMTSRDMAKIGKLVLDKGLWNTRRIVSEEWIEKSTKAHTTITNIDYGYLWWRLPFQLGNDKVEAIAATGNGGQYIIIFPEQRIVAVFTGGAYNSAEDKFPFQIVGRVILPSLLVR